MRRLLDDTLLQQRGRDIVSFVENHDSQPLQSLESVVEPWFKPLAYALILLRREGYPCVFYPDYYGAEYEDYGRDGNKYKIVMPSHRFLIDKFLHARQALRAAGRRSTTSTTGTASAGCGSATTTTRRRWRC